jgi:hypothetical protein
LKASRAVSVKKVAVPAIYNPIRLNETQCATPTAFKGRLWGRKSHSRGEGGTARTVESGSYDAPIGRQK